MIYTCHSIAHRSRGKLTLVTGERPLRYFLIKLSVSVKADKADSKRFRIFHRKYEALFSVFDHMSIPPKIADYGRNT